MYLWKEGDFYHEIKMYDFYFDGDDDEMKYRKFINIT